MASHDVDKAVAEVAADIRAASVTMVMTAIRTLLLQLPYDQERATALAMIGICQRCGYDYGTGKPCRCHDDE